MIGPDEFDILRIHTNISPVLLDQLKKVIDLAKIKRNVVKKVKVSLLPKNLDLIIECIADKDNEKNSPADVQYTLDNLFSRFAKKYNHYITSTN